MEGRMRMLRQLVLPALVLSVATAALAQEGAQVAPKGGAPSGPAAMIVLDGSGSMAGWLDGAKASKMDLTRTALSDALGKLPPSGAVGLVAFGHRRKGNCSDVEVFTPAEPEALGKSLAALASVAPTGKGPLVQALRLAAKAISPGPHRSILVVHDDPDNCSQDACEAAAAIAKSHPGLAINVVTIGGKAATKAAMNCVVAATGGKLFEANDEEALAAAVGESLKLAGLDPNVPAPRPASRPETAAEGLGGPGLALSATLTPGGDAIASPVHWRVRKEGDATGPALSDTTAPSLVVPAQPGAYVIEAQAGLAKATQRVDVAEGKATIAKVNFDAGIVKLAPDPARQGSELLSVSLINGDGNGTTPLFVGRSPGAMLVLPAGRYAIRVEDGLSRQDARLDVKAGSEQTIGSGNAFGRLELDAVSAQDGPAVEAVTYTVEKDDPDAPQGRREVARSAAPRASFTLPAGTYYVTARTRQVEARQRLAVSAGAAVKQTMVLALAKLSLAAKVQASLSPNTQGLKFRVLSLEGEPREVARSAAAEPVLTLPEGRYRIEATLGSENAKAVAETALSAGKDATVNLEIAAGQVTLDRDGASDAIIEVSDESGVVVWHAGTGESATAILAPGRYRYRTADAGERTFEVKTGERQTLKVR